MRVLILALIAVAWPGVAGAAAAGEPWRLVHAWLGAERDRMAGDLERAHAALVARARAAGDVAALARLSDEPPRPRPHGWGVLPEIVPDLPRGSIRPQRQDYALETLSTAYAAEFRDAALLAARSAADVRLPLAPWIDEFERLRERMGNLEDHLDYHARWQAAVVVHRDWFAGRNRLAGQARALVEMLESGAPVERIAAARGALLDRLAPFRRTPGLAIERRPDGESVLPVRITTDIADLAFLERVREAIEVEFSRAEAPRARRFSVRVSFGHVVPESLYPEGAPAPGSPIDPQDHVGRFPVGELVLTTGAASTHAVTGRAVLLGPGPLARRTLAHEFGHLLGFDDAYLRSYEGDSRGTWGVVLVEWSGLGDDLMGNPGVGAVTREMIDTLLEAYGARTPG